jgi:hypothetical protein
MIRMMTMMRVMKNWNDGQEMRSAFAVGMFYLYSTMIPQLGRFDGVYYSSCFRKINISTI